MRFLPALLIPLLLLSACDSLPSGSRCVAAPTPEMQAQQTELLKKLPPDFVARYPVSTQQRSTKDIPSAIREQGSAIKPLFDQLAGRHPYIGQLSVVFALTPAGDVAAVEVTEDDTHDPGINSDILPALKKLQFGSACGKGYFDFSFTFNYSSSSGMSAGLEALLHEIRVSLHKYLAYPIAAIEGHISGTALVRVQIGREGTVAAATLLQTSGSTVLDQEAIAVWTRLPKRGLAIPEDVEPGLKDVVLQLPIKFDLSTPQDAPQQR